MIEKTIRCPSCKNQLTINGNPGDKIQIICPSCNSKGVFTFPHEESFLSESNPIQVLNLTKKFNNFIAVNNISFSVKAGEIFGFLGPNGAGKTTTMKAILSLINTNSGQIKINGISIHKDPKVAHKYVGYLPERIAFYDNLTALQNMYFYADMKNTPKGECKPLLDEMGLGGALDKKVGKFSKGMQQRLGMACALIGSPPILVLDEPSGGLDPRGVALIRKKIREMKSKGTTVFLSSHILSEIQEVCDRVGIIDKGVLVAQDSVSKLSEKLKLKPKITIELEQISNEVVEAVKKVQGVEKVDVKGKNIDIICDPKSKSKVILAVEKAGGSVINIQTKEPSLEEVFLKVTGE
ncbi:MAG: ABC transporter ATP-binding protein [Candidatus Thermoplasmatota archaeon]|nr:ABC transporter ATP-binding protein [Candidatus Thermoplasmatota archaeon]